MKRPLFEIRLRDGLYVIDAVWADSEIEHSKRPSPVRNLHRNG